MLPWVERLLLGETLAEIAARPPWPRPSAPLVVRQLARTLLDLRWAVPSWSGDGMLVAPELMERFRSDGRVGLARQLFDADVIAGEWWAESVGGTMLARQTALQFDWDFKRKADVVLESTDDVQALLDAAEPDLADLILKLGGVDDIWSARDRAFLGTALVAGERKDILFPLYGDDMRLLPDELAELEPVLQREAPFLFGERRAARSRVLHLPRSPVEQVATEVERLPADPAALGPLEVVRARCDRLAERIEKLHGELVAWLAEGQLVRPVCGPTQRHFDALAEICEALPRERPSWLLLTSAFLNEDNVGGEGGLARSLGCAPSSTRFLLVYGHANDGLPEHQGRDIEQWLSRLRESAPEIAARSLVVAGKRRSHEKVVVSSTGEWMVGSWNPASSRPHALVFECSLAGKSPGFARELVGVVGANVEGEMGERFIADLGDALASAPPDPVRAGEAAEKAIGALRRCVDLLLRAIPEDDGSRALAWAAAVRALRRAMQPLLSTVRVELIDEQQTRDAFVTHARAARHSVLLASDRLADSALDRATLRDLRGDGRSRPTVRLVWGREWAGRRPTDAHSREQIQRAKRTIREARDLLGSALLVSDDPMENHAKVLLVDGLRGIVTSENLLSYGGDKGRYESRELGVAFWSPAVARHLLGRFLYHWPDPMASSGSIEELGLPWIAAGNEAWHALAAIAQELDFDWRDPAYIGAVVRDQLDRAAPTDDQAKGRSEAWRDLERRAGLKPFVWLRDEAERLGLGWPATTWVPYDAATDDHAEAMLAEAANQAGPHPAPVQVRAAEPDRRSSIHPLVERVLADMIRIPAGRFRMGDDRVRDERPRHDVVISRPFLLGRTPVTQGLWEHVMGALPHLRDNERHPEHPIIHIGHGDIRAFLERLNALPGAGAFELPTEAQWEYACRAGTDTVYCCGDDPGSGTRPGRLEQYAWTKRSAQARLQRVGLLRPNAWGLHDMHGLVYEAMRDGFRRFERGQVVDPVGPLGDGRVVARGGFWGRFPLDRGKRPENEHFRCSSRQVFEKSHRCSFRLAWRIEEDE